MVGIAASRLKVDLEDDFLIGVPFAVVAGSSVVAVPSNGGRKACDKDDPTSPSIIQTMPTDINAVWAAAGTSPKEAAVAEQALCQKILTDMMNRKGIKDSNCLIVANVDVVVVPGLLPFFVVDDDSASSEMICLWLRRKPRFFSTRNSNPAANTCDRDVAHAAPTMPCFNPLTRIKSPNKLQTPANPTEIMGFLVSFVPMQIACAMVVTTTAGSANARMATYCVQAGAKRLAVGAVGPPQYRTEMGCDKVYKSAANTNPQTVPIPMVVRDTRAVVAVSFWACDLAIKFVAPSDKNNNGIEALSLILAAGPNAASSVEVDRRPTKDVSIRDMSGEHR